MKYVALAAILFASGCQGSAPPDEEPSPTQEVATSSTPEVFSLEAAELPELSKRAKSGDSEAAIRVARHYGLGWSDHAREIEWLLVAAEQGHIGAMRELSTIYSNDLSKYKNCTKAFKWLRRASAEGSAEELREHGIPEQTEYVQTSPDACGPRGNGTSPNNSSKPTPLRGAA